MESSGKLPWFNANGQSLQPYIIGIAGGTASGKTSVSERIIKNLGVPWVALLSMDSFYKPLSPEQRKQALANDFDFDHPDCFDYEKLFQILQDLKRGVKVDVPVYCFNTHNRLEETTPVYGANVIIFEGIFALYDKKVRDMMDLKLFVDTDADVRLSRRLRRDIAERGRDVQGVLTQYNRFVKPSFDEYIYPTLKYSDVIIPRGLDNTAAINVIMKHIQKQLDDRGVIIRPELALSKETNKNVILLPQTNKLRNLHTIARDVSSNRSEFVFYVDQISRLMVEQALQLLDYQEITIETPTGSSYKGLELVTKVKIN
jgi:uridine kinase